MFDQVEQALEERVERWSQLRKTDLPALNQELKQAGTVVIDLDSGSGAK